MSKRFRLNTGGGFEVCGHFVDVFKNSLIPREISDLVEKLSGIRCDLVCDVLSQTNSFGCITETRRYNFDQNNNFCDELLTTFNLLSFFRIEKCSYFEIDLLAEMSLGVDTSNQKIDFPIMKLIVKPL